MPTPKQIQIESVGYDSQFYPRVNGREDWYTVHLYVEALKADPSKADARKKGAFPPIVVVPATGYSWKYIILDGLHRLKSFSQFKLESIWANVERIPQSKWLARSAELNSDGKRGLDTGDKRWVATRLTSEGYKQDDIARILQMPATSLTKLVSTGIQKLKATNNLPEGRANRKINGGHYGFLKAPFTNAAGTGNAQTVLSEQGTTTSRVSNQIVRSFIAMMDSGSMDLTNPELTNDLIRIRDFLAKLKLT